MTASIAGSTISSSASVATRVTPTSSATRCAFSAIASETAATSAPATEVLRTRAWVVPISPAPMIPTCSVMSVLSPRAFQTAVGKCMWPRWCSASSASSGQRVVIAFPRV
jgi:hypothetical protein